MESGKNHQPHRIFQQHLFHEYRADELLMYFSNRVNRIERMYSPTDCFSEIREHSGLNSDTEILSEQFEFSEKPADHGLLI